MKKCTLLFLLICFLCSCADDKTDKPRLELAGIFLNGEDKDYSRNLKGTLPLSAGDYIDVSFRLYGNGADLKTFMVKNDNENFDYTMSFGAEQVSNDFSNISGGILGYKDDVRNTWVAVKLRVKGAKNEKSTISFYLNSKAPDCEGAAYYLELETTTEPRKIKEE